MIFTLAFCGTAGSAAAQEAAVVRYLWHDRTVSVETEGRLRLGGRKTRATDRFAVASTGKALLAVALLQLHERGVPSLQEPVKKWLPKSVVDAFGGLKGLSIMHLLQMRSGLVDYYHDDYLIAVFDDPNNQTIETALGVVAGERPKFKPGRRFDYSNTNYLLAQLVLERASGLPMSQYFQQHILGPAGMKDSFVFGTRELPRNFAQGFEDLGDGPEDISFYYQGSGFGDGPLISTASDMAAFYRALFVDKVLLGPAGLALMLDDPLGEGYGMGMEVEQLRGLGTVYGHSGGDLGFSADIRFAPGLNAIAVVLMAESNRDGSASYDMLRELAR